MIVCVCVCVLGWWVGGVGARGVVEENPPLSTNSVANSKQADSAAVDKIDQLYIHGHG